MRLRKTIFGFLLLMAFLAVLAVACSALGTLPAPEAAPPSYLLGVMIDNHEDAMPHQRGLEKALLIEEQFVEGFITRFAAVFDAADLPEQTGPIRSVRPYFVDGTSPILSALFHAGGSPEGLEKIAASPYATGFNALRLDTFFTYDDIAPAPHNRYVTVEKMRTLLEQVTNPVPFTAPLFATGPFTPEKPATSINMNYRSPIHNVSYAYDPVARTYLRTNGMAPARDTPKNILMLESDVAVPGPFGRLSVRMEGEGAAMLFRDGGMIRGTWGKTGEDAFFVFTDSAGNPMQFAEGQVWMTVLDSFERVSWE